MSPPELFEECDSKVIVLFTVRAFNKELNPLPKLFVDSVEIHNLFPELKFSVLLLELPMET